MIKAEDLRIGDLVRYGKDVITLTGKSRRINYGKLRF